MSNHQTVVAGRTSCLRRIDQLASLSLGQLMETSLESLVTMGVSTRPKPSLYFCLYIGVLLNLFANAPTPSSYVFQFQPASRCRPSWSTSPSPPRPRTGCTFSGTSALAARLKDWGDQGEWLRQVNMKTSTEVFNANPGIFTFIILKIVGDVVNILGFGGSSISWHPQLQKISNYVHGLILTCI